MYELLLAKQERKTPIKHEERLSTASKSKQGYKFINTIVRTSDLNIRTSDLKEEPVEQDQPANIIIKQQVRYDRLGSQDLNESYCSRVSNKSRRSRAQRSQGKMSQGRMTRQSSQADIRELNDNIISYELQLDQPINCYGTQDECYEFDSKELSEQMPEMPEPMMKPHRPNQLSNQMYSRISSISELRTSPNKQLISHHPYLQQETLHTEMSIPSPEV